MPADVLITGAWFAVAVIAAVVVLTAADARTMLAVLVGLTGGLQTAQVAKLHVFCFAVALWLVLGPLRERGTPLRPGAWLLLPLCTAVLALSAPIGSLVNSSVTAVQLLVLAVAGAAFAAFGDRGDVRAALTGLLLVTTFSSAVGVLQYVGILPHELFDGQNRPIGIYLEPDWLGMFSAVGLVLSFSVRRPSLRLGAAALNLAAVLLAAARASWIALAVVAVLGVLTARALPRAERLRGGWRLAGFGVVVGAALLAAVPELAKLLGARLQGVSASGPDVSARARQQQFAALQHLESIAPWHGLGLSASGRVGVSGGITYIGTATNNVASNWVLGWWVDGKYLAVPLIALFVVAALVTVHRPAGQVLTVVLVSSLFSNALYIPVGWLALGACLIGSRTSPDRTGTQREVSPVGDAPDPVPVGAAPRATTEERS